MTAPHTQCQPGCVHAPEVFLFYRHGVLHHIHTDRKVFEEWMEKAAWQYPPDECEIARYVPESRVEELTKALEKVRSYNVDIAACRINYRPFDHIQVIDEALGIPLDKSGSAT